MLALDEPIRVAIRENGHNDEIRALAQDSGMKLMQEYALEHVRAGLTTLEEVQRVVPFSRLHALQCISCRRELSRGFLYCPHCGKKQISAKAAKVKKAAQIPQGVMIS
jgi:predicted RNA-binding Zn-ribbon protein involved in translation (DUF1610 family)